MPLLQGLFYSFTDFGGFGDWEFVGLNNYIEGFQDSRIIHSYFFTIGFSIVSTILVNIIGLLIALGINSNIKFSNTIRGIYFIPYMLGTLIIAYVFSFLFSQLVPSIGEALGIEFLQYNILGNQNLAWVGVVIVTVWQAAAFNTILYLSGLVTIDDSLYEAAEIDGASSFEKFRHITVPMIIPFFTINLVVSMKNFLMAFDQVVALTEGGPGTATESVSFLIYQGAFAEGQFAYQSANAIVFFIIIVLISFFQFKVLEGRER
ncbi:putative sugar ABC transporter permease protein [Tetragenococcus halophilus subsp. halophilus]|nr:putative sugar ABC transporter permease protein [Tetragenococcus halophilus subsp. halophilus]GBD63482.1 putative sugar ABC transporter permease protein [Tetragenococcus halophilus subsp. flandriensis]GBD70656.1 putative sugar ABC transporter permease protein [Tetragenococcus halophilus subsp. halophilus]GBD79242.1 putative sugar ABC transporter permease protein [Tetragenococcus halophilus subsp. halophilus]GBD83205.1 putative sugar ABC transporter permease protein [Tetragenococcus halophilu